MIHWLNKLLGWLGFEIKKIDPPPIVQHPEQTLDAEVDPIKLYLKGDIENFTYEELMDFCSKTNAEKLDESILLTLKVLNNKDYKERLSVLDSFKPIFDVPAPNNVDDNIELNERIDKLKSKL